MHAAATIGSLAVHALACALLLVLAPRDTREPTSRTGTAIELVDSAPPIETIAAPPSSGGGGGGDGDGAAATVRRPDQPRVHARRAEVDPRGTITIERGDEGTGGEGAGTGAGIGRARGRGFGFGDGGALELPALPPVPPPPPADEPPPSKARPAQLVYPKRHREVADAELFVARVTIDDEGYVVGARLVRGFGGPRDAQAADLIWKFRYAPALDDAGRPIRSTLDQRFLVDGR